MEKVIRRAVIAITSLFIVVFVGVVMLEIFRPLIFSGSRDRMLKNLNADINGGLKRTVTVYSYSGSPIKTWNGRIDLSASTNEVNMIINNDKRVIIQGGVIVVEEED